MNISKLYNKIYDMKASVKLGNTTQHLVVKLTSVILGMLPQ